MKFKLLNKLTNHIDNTLKVILAGLMGLLLLNVCWQVFSRYVLQSPSSFTDELARYLLIWVALIGAAYMTGQQEHLAIDLIAKKMPTRFQSVLVNGLVCLFAFSVMIVGGMYLVLTILSLEQLSATLQIPMGYVYLAIPFSGVLIAYYSVVNILRTFKGGEA